MLLFLNPVSNAEEGFFVTYGLLYGKLSLECVVKRQLGEAQFFARGAAGFLAQRFSAKADERGAPAPPTRSKQRPTSSHTNNQVDVR